MSAAAELSSSPMTTLVKCKALTGKLAPDGCAVTFPPPRAATFRGTAGG
jgi:hypothetical protein